MLPSPIARRIIGGACLTSAALIIAHTTNAFVADALVAPPYPSHVSASAPESFGASDPAASQRMIEDILQSGLFELPHRLQTAGPAAAAPPPPIGAARRVALLGTVFGQDGGVMAVFEDLASKQQALHRLGAEVPNVGVLAAIEKHRVLFQSGPSEEWLPLAITQQTLDGSLDSPPQPVNAQAAPARRVLDRREVTAAVNDPTRLMTHAQAVPFLTDGRLDGFRLSNVVPEGFFDRIGLRANDIVQRINGVELRDPGMLLSLFQQLRNERSVRVDLVRNSRHQTLTYDIR